jgi:uncharacterized protein YyaL (SSP411 family)
MNRLARERSPYLLQHANNPVDWFAWGDEAFARARSEDKPIFLSIGYSTCHWCHVMAHESFESAAVAAVLNELFVPVKVDREERPDVDRVYMAFVQGTTGSGGWPMSVWLTPDLKPFYGGTYFPPDSRWGRPGFVEVLREIGRAWREDRPKIEQSASTVIEQLRSASKGESASDLPSTAALSSTVAQFRASFDARHGGFGTSPKFPRPTELLFLFREHARTGATEPRDMALHTLAAMAVGGMRDHVGGGFHRYSVDGAWRVPHFEKMLYDQAQLVLAYLEGAQASDDRFLLEVAEDTLRYVMREMTDPAGGFYSAEDADSVPPEQAGGENPHTSEGAFYLWRADELDALLGDAAPIVKRRFGIEAGGNAPVDPQQEFVGKNLLYVARSVDDLSKEFSRSDDEIVRMLDKARLDMFAARIARPRPHLDDKVLTAWNGLMIAAFARAARLVLATTPDGVEAAAPYLEAARRAASFLRTTMWHPKTGTLLRRYRDGHAEIEGYAEDYAYLIFGLLELFQADPRPEWLEWARVLQREQDARFWDEEGGGWFSTTGTDSTVLLRMKEDYDGAEPTASSVSVMNLLVLLHLVDDPAWRPRIDRTLALFARRLEQAGRAVPMMAAALSTHTAGLRQVVVVGEGAAADALVRAATAAYRPFALVLALTPDAQQALATVTPFLAAMRPLDGTPAAYVCRDFACRAPVTSPEELARELA